MGCAERLSTHLGKREGEVGEESSSFVAPDALAVTLD